MEQAGKKKKRLVVTVGGYYPTFIPPGICFEKFVSCLRPLYDITVVTCRHSNEVKEDAFDFDGVHVVQVTDAINRHQVSATGNKRKTPFWMGVRFIYSLCRGWGTKYWAKGAILRELERQYSISKFDTVVSVGFPITMHQACKSFIANHERVRWITYSTDTYHKSKAGSHLRILAILRSWAERLCYRKASYNFFSREIMNVCQGFLGPEILAKSAILDYMLFESSGSSGFDTRFLDKDKVNLLYAGGFIENARSPEYFLSILEKLPANSKIIWHVFSSGCYGDVIKGFAQRFPDRVLYHKPVKVNEIRDVMNACDILVNVSNDMDQFFPSKVFDYLSTGKPILNFTYPKRSKNPLFEKHPYYIDIEMFGDVENDVRRVAEFCERNKGCGLSMAEVAAVYPEYTPEQNLKEFIHQLSL